MATFKIIEFDGLRFSVDVTPDYDNDAPWDREDGHGKVRDVNIRLKGFQSYKHPGERVIHIDGYNVWLYDFAGAIAKAKEEGWGSSKATPDMTPGKVRELAVLEDMELMRGYLRNEWGYVAITVTLLDVNGAKTSVSDYLHGLESYSDEYIEDEATRIASEIAFNYKGQSEIVTTIKIR